MAMTRPAPASRRPRPCRGSRPPGDASGPAARGRGPWPADRLDANSVASSTSPNFHLAAARPGVADQDRVLRHGAVLRVVPLDLVRLAGQREPGCTRGDRQQHHHGQQAEDGLVDGRDRLPDEHGHHHGADQDGDEPEPPLEAPFGDELPPRPCCRDGETDQGHEEVAPVAQQEHQEHEGTSTNCRQQGHHGVRGGVGRDGDSLRRRHGWATGSTQGMPQGTPAGSGPVRIMVTPSRPRTPRPVPW